LCIDLIGNENVTKILEDLEFGEIEILYGNLISLALRLIFSLYIYILLLLIKFVISGFDNFLNRLFNYSIGPN